MIIGSILSSVLFMGEAGVMYRAIQKDSGMYSLPEKHSIVTSMKPTLKTWTCEIFQSKLSIETRGYSSTSF